MAKFWGYARELPGRLLPRTHLRQFPLVKDLSPSGEGKFDLEL